MFHPLCLNMNEDLDKIEKDYLTSWECPNCTSRTPKGNSVCLPLSPRTPTISRPTKRKAVLSPYRDSKSDPLAVEIRLLREDLQDMKHCIKALTETITQCISRTTALESRVVQAEAKIATLTKDNSVIPALKQHIVSLEQQVSTQQNNIMRNEIEIVGINEHPHENLTHIVTVIAQRIGF